ncbi:hypothetical protein [Tsukamurella paurometabola]|uniref:Uncharacterized protein n=1 Tax=Tsukamurella paurometabola TaxID=2061 RepID=A0ABS5N9U6_TSUPA|nr:hypothetical protein [Tsukamurella paurometabola]MBS4101045.1 hypothetical protein [Tsukamurella paurometabola]
MITSTRTLLGTAAAAVLGLGALATGAGTATAAPDESGATCRVGTRMFTMAMQEMTSSTPGQGPDTVVPGQARILVNVPEWYGARWSASISWRDAATGVGGALGPQPSDPMAPNLTSFARVRTGAGEKVVTARAVKEGGETLTCSGTFTVR